MNVLKHFACFLIAAAIGFFGAMTLHTAYLRVTCCAPAKVTHVEIINLRDWRAAR